MKPGRALMAAMNEVIGLFPVPLLRAPAALDPALVSGLLDYLGARAATANNSSDRLSHTTMLRPTDTPLLVAAAARLTPLFGEKLPWALKEMWGNVLDTGGRQAMHNHANSFISGVAYLTPTHPESRTVFMKSP